MVEAIQDELRRMSERWCSNIVKKSGDLKFSAINVIETCTFRGQPGKKGGRNPVFPTAYSTEILELNRISIRKSDIAQAKEFGKANKVLHVDRERNLTIQKITESKFGVSDHRPFFELSRAKMTSAEINSGARLARLLLSSIRNRNNEARISTPAQPEANHRKSRRPKNPRTALAVTAVLNRKDFVL